MVFRGDVAHYHVKAEGRHPAFSQLVLQGSAAGGHTGSPVFKGDVTTWPVLLACGGEKVTLIEGHDTLGLEQQRELLLLPVGVLPSRRGWNPRGCSSAPDPSRAASESSPDAPEEGSECGGEWGGGLARC